VRVEGTSYQRGRRYGIADGAGPAIIGPNWDWHIWLAAGNPCQACYERLDIDL
jgi:hypothetical protein